VSIVYPKGIVEDVLVKVDKFVFLDDLVVLDMEEYRNVPIILRCIFFNTYDIVVKVRQGKPTLRWVMRKLFLIYLIL